MEDAKTIMRQLLEKVEAEKKKTLRSFQLHQELPLHYKHLWTIERDARYVLSVLSGARDAIEQRLNPAVPKMASATRADEEPSVVKEIRKRDTEKEDTEKEKTSDNLEVAIEEERARIKALERKNAMTAQTLEKIPARTRDLKQQLQKAEIQSTEQLDKRPSEEASEEITVTPDKPQNSQLDDETSQQHDDEPDELQFKEASLQERRQYSEPTSRVDEIQPMSDSEEPPPTKPRKLQSRHNGGEPPPMLLGNTQAGRRDEQRPTAQLDKQYKWQDGREPPSLCSLEESPRRASLSLSTTVSRERPQRPRPGQAREWPRKAYLRRQIRLLTRRRGREPPSKPKWRMTESRRKPPREHPGELSTRPSRVGSARKQPERGAPRGKLHGKREQQRRRPKLPAGRCTPTVRP